MNCAHCGKKIGVLRKLHDSEFCSDAHRRAFLKKQEELALEFLLKSRPRHEPEPAPGEIVPPAAEPERVPALAGSVAEPVQPASAHLVPVRNSQPQPVRCAPIPPAGVLVREPQWCVARFRATACDAVSPAARAERISLRCVPFPMRGPHLPVAAIRPLWIEPARQAAAGRRHADFVFCRPRWIRSEARLSRAPLAARFNVVPVVAAAGPALSRSAFQLAGPSRHRVESITRPVAALGHGTRRWFRASAAPDQPRYEFAHRSCGFTHCEAIRTASPCAMTRPAGGQLRRAGFTWRPAGARLHQPRVAIALSLGRIRDSHLIRQAPAAVAPPSHGVISAPFRSLVTQGPEFGHFPSFTLLGRSFEPAPQVPVKLLRPVAAGAPLARPISLVWKFPLRLAPAPAIGAMPPDFAAPAAIAPDAEPKTRLTERLLHFWRVTPGWVRRLAMVGSASVMIWPGAVWLSRSTPARDARAAIESHIRRRAAIDLQDDFRSGLSQWSGAPNWAASWSYDGTGFARPGRLALLSSSLPLTDYRFEFLAQIDRKAVGWVFRAADPHNFYAIKLVESRRGVATFSIVRYLFIDGREQLKTQLPVPVNAAAKTMFRVRQEVRGTQFTTYLDGRVIDTWSDPSLARGGIGFFSDSGEVAYIRWVEVAQQDDFLGRLCSYAASLDPK